MNILEACFTPSLGGLELYCLNTAQQLQERGHRVYVWLANGSRINTHPITEQLDIRLFREPGYFNPLFCYKASKIIRENKIDIIHLHRSKDLASFALLKNIPKVLTLQIESRLKKRDIFHRFVYSRVDRVITITERMRGFVLEAIPVDPDRVFSLHYGIDVEKFQATADDGIRTRQRLHIPEDGIIIGLVGRLEESKGQHILLEAFAMFCADLPQTHLMLVGEFPPENEGYNRTLKKLAEELNISDRIHFTGFQTDIASIYAALDICILASREETFGLVLIEAMAQGVPIIATNAGGVPEIIRDQHNGFLIPPGDPRALADAIVKLIKDSALRNQFSENGLKVVRDKFSLQNHLQTLENHFSEVLETRGYRNR